MNWTIDSKFPALSNNDFLLGRFRFGWRQALTGAFTFTADLARAMTPVPAGTSVDFFSASSYGASATVSGDVKLQMGTKITPAGRHVLVVSVSCTASCLPHIDCGMFIKSFTSNLDKTRSSFLGTGTSAQGSAPMHHSTNFP